MLKCATKMNMVNIRTAKHQHLTKALGACCQHASISIELKAPLCLSSAKLAEDSCLNLFHAPLWIQYVLCAEIALLIVYVNYAHLKLTSSKRQKNMQKCRGLTYHFTHRGFKCKWETIRGFTSRLWSHLINWHTYPLGLHVCVCVCTRAHLPSVCAQHTSTCVSVREKHLWGYFCVSNGESKRYHINILIAGSVRLLLRDRLNVVTDEG